MPTLILTPRFTDDAQALWRAAGRLGWSVERLTSWRVPDELRAVSDPVLYLEALFGPTLAEQFGLRLLEPAVDWLPRLPEEFRKRRVSLMPLHAARRLTEPAFIKPPNDKSFPARVYVGSELPDGYDEDSPVLVAEVVRWEVEFRCFVLDRQPETLSVYLRGGELQREQGFAASAAELTEAEAVVRAVLADQRVDLPRAAVLDVGVIAGRGWAVVEQNAAWGSGIYGCDPARVLEVLRHAAVSDAEPEAVSSSNDF
ncbi:MAG: ATP-grasp domain-containing protein [Planctomycetia bacterium]